jgi:hypothetical protein
LLLKDLRQFESILGKSRKGFDTLIKDPTLQNLEGRPSALKKYFASLPTEDPRRRIWDQQIELLREYNQSGTTLVNTFQSSRDDRAILPEFTTACTRYLEHVDQWEIVWKAVESSEEASDEPLASFASRFPSELEPALDKQIKEVAKRAGLPVVNGPAKSK